MPPREGWSQADGETLGRGGQEPVEAAPPLQVASGVQCPPSVAVLSLVCALCSGSQHPRGECKYHSHQDVKKEPTAGPQSVRRQRGR